MATLSRKSIIIITLIALGITGAGILSFLLLRPQNSLSRLEALLQAGDWKGADEETYFLFLQAADRVEEQWLEAADMAEISCDTLNQIDTLWKQYSADQFGYSVQTTIWAEVGKPYSYNEGWETLGDRTGWRVNGEWLTANQVIFNTSAPTGHLPAFVSHEEKFADETYFYGVDSSGYWTERTPIAQLYARFEECSQ